MWYTIAEDGIAVERGVWWKMKHLVPYSRVMSADIIQGPISRRSRIGSVIIHTAGYTGPSGGRSKIAEAEIIGIDDFLEMRDLIITMVKGKPLFTIERSSIEQKILEEVERIRKIIEKQYSKT
ncbi:MAG: PH domain-containing protein [Ignisphaera sp.]